MYLSHQGATDERSKVKPLNRLETLLGSIRAEGISSGREDLLQDAASELHSFVVAEATGVMAKAALLHYLEGSSNGSWIWGMLPSSVVPLALLAEREKLAHLLSQIQLPEDVKPPWDSPEDRCALFLRLLGDFLDSRSSPSGGKDTAHEARNEALLGHLLDILRLWCPQESKDGQGGEGSSAERYSEYHPCWIRLLEAAVQEHRSGIVLEVRRHTRQLPVKLAQEVC